MSSHHSFTFRPAARVAALLLTSVLAACAGQGARQDKDAANLPADPNALVLGAEMALQRGQYLEASQAYLRAAQAANDEELAEQATRVAHEHRQWTVVQAAAERWLELNHTNEEARRFAAFAALHLYRINTAAEHLGTLLDTAFINPQAGFLALLPQLADEGTPSGVTAVLRQLVVKYPEVTEAHYALAQAASQSDNLKLAMEHARKARELGPYWAPAGLLLARMQMLTGDADGALVTAKQVLEQDNQDSHRLEYALMLMQAGKEEEGRKELNALATSESTGTVVERALADIDFQLGNRDSAAQRFSNLVSSGRFVYESLFYLGAIAEGRDSLEDASQIYGRVTGGEFAMAAQTRLARIKAKQEGLEAGLKHLEEFGATRPQYRIDTIISRANLLSSNGDKAGALALLDQALKVYPDAVELRFARIFQLESSDKVDEAITDLRKLVADRPNDPTATNALGYTLVDRTRHHKEGLDLIEQALAETPDNGAVLDSMGWALHRVGRHEDALNYLEQAKRRINDPEVELHLGEVLLALDRKSDALDVWKKASERYPENDELKQRLEKLN
ncbi:tetratricopeptide repeat protein [Steroidobacter sp. S1-65]|uniref:Tetratricopeptide repeat protein n=1 Tax=Steroidobacter gossypii TaxID=2805490 RepID=A0ABS1WQA8_9GAMM|nr:tetratricopeptide repeat protein [Steroidobacter gossypii]MBM0103145.1 tetratricopeptide repeat protein [Steroidobacter gossypii]